LPRPSLSVRFEVDDSAYGINGKPPCEREFFNGTECSASSLGKFCRLDVPEPVTVTAGGARVVFRGRKNLHYPASRVGVRVFYEVMGKVFISLVVVQLCEMLVLDTGSE